MSETLTVDYPEQGQLARVRSRHVVVTEVLRSELPGKKQHLVTLQSIEDDALGEELQVIWELESVSLPSATYCLREKVIQEGEPAWFNVM